MLGQLPRSFVLVYALIAIAPAIIAGLLAYLIYKRVTGNGKSQLSEVKSWLLAVALAIILGIVPLVFLPFVRRTTFHGVIRPHWQIFVACFVFNLVFVRLALYLLPKVQIPGLQEITCIGVCTFALIPAVASVTATYRFPDVRLCGQSFADSGTHDNYAVGNLIGTSGQWIYVAETITRSPRPGKYIFIGSYIAVIPLSAVNLKESA